MAKTLQEKIVEAEGRAAQHLGNANDAAERGDNAKEQLLLTRSQYWLDRANKLRGWN